MAIETWIICNSCHRTCSVEMKDKDLLCLKCKNKNGTFKINWNAKIFNAEQLQTNS